MVRHPSRMNPAILRIEDAVITKKIESGFVGSTWRVDSRTRVFNLHKKIAKYFWTGSKFELNGKLVGKRTTAVNNCPSDTCEHGRHSLCFASVQPWVTPCNYLNQLQSQQTEQGGECGHRVSCFLTAVHRWTWLSGWKLINYCWVLIMRTISWLLNQGLDCDSNSPMDDEGHWHRQR
jgi:hypothetical protein